MRRIQIADLFNRLFQVMTEKFTNLLAGRMTIEDQCADVVFTFIVYDQIALAGYSKIGMDIVENANLATDGFNATVFRLCPNRGPIGKAAVAQQGIVAELHNPVRAQSCPAVKIRSSCQSMNVL